MLERTDAITKKVLETIRFVLAYHTAFLSHKLVTDTHILHGELYLTSWNSEGKWERDSVCGCVFVWRLCMYVCVCVVCVCMCFVCVCVCVWCGCVVCAPVCVCVVSVLCVWCACGVC